MLFKSLDGYGEELIQLPTDGDGNRFYTLPDEDTKFMSVTTFLSKFPNVHLERWKEDVGVRTSGIYGHVASVNGTIFHQYVEDFLNGKEVIRVPGFQHDIAWENYQKTKHKLTKSITKLIGNEVRVYSKKLRLAGTFDCLAYWNGVLSIIDFKTSDKLKCEVDILSYFLQATIYSLMVEEMYGVKVSNVIVIMLTPELQEPLIFERSRNNYLPKLKEMIREKRNLLGV